MAAYSLFLPNLISSIPKTLNLSSLSFPAKTQFLISSCSSIAFPSTLTLLRKSRSLELTTVTKVALTSKYGQEEEEGVLSGDHNGSFSPDLKVFVGNLPFTVDSSELAGLFESAGNVEMCEVIYDKITGRSRGFGFVTMSTVEEVEAAAQQFNGYELNGRALRVNSGPPPPREEFPSSGFRSGGGDGGGSFDSANRGFRSGGGGGGSFDSDNRGFRSGGGGGGGGSFDSANRGFRSGGGGGSFDSANRVYVGNLSWGVDNLSLETLFSEQGKVLDARVVYDRETGRSRGFGFVTLSSAAEVNSAISSLDGSDLDGRNIRVSAAEAKPPRREF